MTRALVGAIAGVAATALMTVAAGSLHQRLPQRQRYPLPPRELTERAASKAGIRLGEAAGTSATLITHFGFGACAGALYALMAGAARGHATLTGVSYALSVWAASYFGWVPMLNLLRPASTHPPARNLLMISVHVLWGAALGLMTHRLFQSLDSIRGGPIGDR